MIPRMALTAMAVLLVVPAPTPAQEPPTVDGVLQRFAAGEDLNRAGSDAGSLLRQVRGPTAVEDIEALIEGLVEVALAPDVCANFLCSAATRARSALRYAVRRPGTYVDVDGGGYLDAGDIRGVPVPEAFDALVLIYETLAARALAEGGDDPFLEAARGDHAHRTPDGHRTTFEHPRLRGSLRDVFHADMAPGGRGWAYVLALFERGKPPCREREGPPDCTTGRLARPGARRATFCTRTKTAGSSRARGPGPDPTRTSGSGDAAVPVPGTGGPIRRTRGGRVQPAIQALRNRL